jgi:hypothetical protein
VALATLVAIGIGLHNLGEVSRSAPRSRSWLALGTFLIVGFWCTHHRRARHAAPVAQGARIRLTPAR